MDSASLVLLLLGLPRLVGLVLLGNRDPRGWVLAIGASTASVGWAMWTGAYGLVAVSTLTIFVCLRGSKRWAHCEDDYRARFHSANNRLAVLELELSEYRQMDLNAPGLGR